MTGDEGYQGMSSERDDLYRNLQIHRLEGVKVHPKHHNPLLYDESVKELFMKQNLSDEPTKQRIRRPHQQRGTSTVSEWESSSLKPRPSIVLKKGDDDRHPKASWMKDPEGNKLCLMYDAIDLSQSNEDLLGSLRREKRRVPLRDLRADHLQSNLIPHPEAPTADPESPPENRELDLGKGNDVWFCDAPSREGFRPKNFQMHDHLYVGPSHPSTPPFLALLTSLCRETWLRT